MTQTLLVFRFPTTVVIVSSIANLSEDFKNPELAFAPECVIMVSVPQPRDLYFHFPLFIYFFFGVYTASLYPDDINTNITSNSNQAEQIVGGVHLCYTDIIRLSINLSKNTEVGTDCIPPALLLIFAQVLRI